MDLEQGPLSLVSTFEELLERKSGSYCQETRDYGLGDLPRWLRDTLYPQKLALTSPTSGGHSVGIVCSQTKATELSECVIMHLHARLFLGVYFSGFEYVWVHQL
jgi:hypothetical protein